MADAWQTHGKRMANARQTHGKRMANAWQPHGNRMANASKRMANASQTHRKHMANTGQWHGNIDPGDSCCWMKANLSLFVQLTAVVSQSPGPALRRENRLRHEFLAPVQWHGGRRVAGLHAGSDPLSGRRTRGEERFGTSGGYWACGRHPSGLWPS